MSGKPDTPVVVPGHAEKKVSRCPYRPAFLAGTMAERNQRQGNPGALQIPSPAADVLLWASGLIEPLRTPYSASPNSRVRSQPISGLVRRLWVTL